ncbi:MAG TPA: CHASE4 domain-containing protein [Negativicutes bacterium]|nr:CHASE4 domain-containing protein [Negativicutes bacterium]
MRLDEGLMMVTSHPIIRSDYSGEVRGNLILGRLLDQEASPGKFIHLAEQTGRKLSLWGGCVMKCRATIITGQCVQRILRI